MKKKLLAIVLTLTACIIFGSSSYADNGASDSRGGVISGRVLNASDSQPMEYVNIALFRSSDSSLVTGTITNPDGHFALEKIPAGDYYLRLTFLGFNDRYTDEVIVGSRTLHTDLGDLKMEAVAAEIGGVSIVADRAKVEYQIDKRVINVSQDIVAKGGTAVSVLENTPSVMVDPEGNVSLRGSYDYVVLIDGKPTALKGSDALKQISAASIKQIEVITNPSAKYEADGKAGIINIIQKKDKLQGMNGTASLSLGTQNKNSGNMLINYRKNKVNVFAGIDYAKNKYVTDITVKNQSFLEAGTQYIDETVQQYNHNDNLSGKLGIDYEMNDKNAFSLSGNYGLQGYDQGAHAQFNYFYSDSQKQYFKSNGDLDVTGNVPGLNIDYTHKFAENHSLSISGTYSAWDGMDENLFTEYTTDENYKEQATQSSLSYTKDNFNYQYRLNADYKKPVKTGTLEAGFQYRYENRMDDLDFRNLDVETNEWITNALYTYKLDYSNDIYSGYATYSATRWGIGYMAGVRTEYFTRTIKFSNDEDAYNYDKFMLYPSLHLTKSIKDKHQFQLSYSRRINRPLPWLLNKTPGYIDPNNIFQGSPELEPEFTDAFELNYRVICNKVFTLSTQTYYRNTTNSFNTNRTLGEDGIMVHELINADRSQSYGIELGMDFNLTPWWQLSTGTNLYHYSLDATSAFADTRSNNTFDARIISNFTFKKGTRIQAIGYVRGPSIDAQGENGGFYTVNLAVSQSILKGKVNVGLSAQNLFNSIQFDYLAVSDNYNNSYKIATEGLLLQFTASYSFNNFQNKQRGRADDASFRGGGAF